MFHIPFTKAAREAKRRKNILNAARVFVLSYEDIASVSSKMEFANLRQAWEAGDVDKCSDFLALLDPPKSCAIAREWLDILVVSISVAMCFRAYFYEPFNIPTGSMMPTLYGNHSVEVRPSQKTFWDGNVVLRWVKWLVTGEMYEEAVAGVSGRLCVRPTNTGYNAVYVAGDESHHWMIPTDAFQPQSGDFLNGQRNGGYVEAGKRIWSGYVRTGDFLFVNRWLWNFRHPRRGDVMIFSTTGIDGLAQGTHYIKRMTGVPGDELQIRDDRLYVNGKLAEGPRKVDEIQNHLQQEYNNDLVPGLLAKAFGVNFASECYPFAGYRVTGVSNPRFTVPGRTLAKEEDVVKLGKDAFYACGDNSPSSFDSRYWGPVPASKLRGIAGGVFWPLASPRWGSIR